MDIREKLFALRDEKYKKFHISLIPTIDPDTVIGVRIPDIRKLAKECFNSGKYQDFLDALPHRYYEENNLHGYIIEQITDYNTCVKEIEKLLPYIDNWASCDTISPKVFAKHLEELLPRIDEWLNSQNTYTIRFGICALMKHFLDKDFHESVLKKVAEIESKEYYVKMAVAWFFATALTKRYSDTLPYLQNPILSPWVHNKAIQKAIESLKIPKNQKEYLKTLKIKE